MAAAILAIWGMFAFTASPALTHEPKAPPQQAKGPVPLYTDLGTLTYPITTTNEMTQKYFDQGLRLTYAFNHSEALRAFHEAARHDPTCAICYWGQAFVLGPNINAGMDNGAVSPAVSAIQKARRLAKNASGREQALIYALAKRYSKESKADRIKLNESYAKAMEEATKRFPKDDEIATLYVDSIMNLSPWDYWKEDGTTPKGKIGDAIEAAEKVLARNPNHPGAIHLYIHLTEASKTPELAESYANRLASLMPGAGHIVHMGSHTFFRVGRYHDSSEINKKAVRADEKFLQSARDKGFYATSYYPHNIHFVLISAQMAGDERTAIEYAKRLKGKVRNGAAAEIGWIQLIIPAPYFAHVQFSSPETILGLPDPGNEFPFVKAMWHYARGEAYARRGQADKARTEAARIAGLSGKSGIHYPADIAGIVPDLYRIARHIIEGRIAMAEGKAGRAVKEFKIASAIQDKLPYLEPPFWYYSVHQSLGAALLQAGKAQEAEQVFQKSLRILPKNGWALYGLMEAQKAQGKKKAAKATEKRFRKAWAGDPKAMNLKRL
jgi:tetratricopeptide (TPR) repeat protein